MKLKRYCLAVTLASVLFLAMGLPAFAVEAGRYQALEISVGKKSEYNIFILDTKEGHMWLLETKESRVSGKLSGGLKYQGKLRPGNKRGACGLDAGRLPRMVCGQSCSLLRHGSGFHRTLDNQERPSGRRHAAHARVRQRPRHAGSALWLRGVGRPVLLSGRGAQGRHLGCGDSAGMNGGRDSRASGMMTFQSRNRLR